jgi:hypothetical protein
MVYKFENKKAALDFCLEVNRGEGIFITEENQATGYALPFEYMGFFYVLADEVTSKYTDQEPIDLFVPFDLVEELAAIGIEIVKAVDLFNGVVQIHYIKEGQKIMSEMQYQTSWGDRDIFNFLANERD